MKERRLFKRRKCFRDLLGKTRFWDTCRRSPEFSDMWTVRGKVAKSCPSTFRASLR